MVRAAHLHVGGYDPIDDWCIAGGGLAAWVLWQRQWFMRAHPDAAALISSCRLVIIRRLPQRDG